MSGVIAFTVPAGLGLYWIIGNIYQLFQQMFINIFVLKKRRKASEAAVAVRRDGERIL
jgi:YidC/Oxa1 family membrane protein insertase